MLNRLPRDTAAGLCVVGDLELVTFGPGSVFLAPVLSIQGQFWEDVGVSDAQTLLEREAELDSLTRLLPDITASGGKVVLVRGEAGIGRTALERKFLARSSEEAHILFGRCDDLLTARPLGPFWDMARRETSLLEPLEGGVRSYALDAILDLMERGLRPTIVVIEDTHWADEATLDTIRLLGRRIDRTEGLLLLTFRDEEKDLDHPLRGV